MPARISRFGTFPLILVCMIGSHATTSAAQNTPPLDPVRDAAGAPLERDIHQPLPEQYIWTAPDAPANDTDRIQYVFPAPNEKTEPHFFRASFNLSSVPVQATLYIAGPRSAEVYL